MPSSKRHSACPETRKCQNLLHTFRPHSHSQVEMSKPRGSLKKQATFLHHHCYNPGDRYHQGWECGFKGSSWSPFSSLSLTLQCGSELPGHRREYQSTHSCCRDWSYVLSHRLCWLLSKAWRLAPCFGLSTCPICRPHSLWLPTLLSETKWVLWPKGAQSTPVTGPPIFGFITNPFSWQLPKALIATSPFYSPQGFPALAGLHWGLAFSLFPSSPLQATLPPDPCMPASPLNTKVLPNTVSYTSRSSGSWFEERCGLILFLISFFICPPQSPPCSPPPRPWLGKPRDKVQLVLSDSVSQTSY